MPFPPVFMAPSNPGLDAFLFFLPFLPPGLAPLLVAPPFLPLLPAFLASFRAWMFSSRFLIRRLLALA